jgi:hypothetical protein
MQLLLAGCDHPGRLPTAASAPSGDPAATTLQPRDLDADSLATARDAPRSRQDRAVIPEAREALGAILTGEQAYFQRFGTYTDAADTSEIRLELGVYLAEPSRRWAFSASDASVTGFVAHARGREGTEAEGFVVTLAHERGRPLLWSVRRQRPSPG